MNKIFLFGVVFLFCISLVESQSWAVGTWPPTCCTTQFTFSPRNVLGFADVAGVKEGGEGAARGQFLWLDTLPAYQSGEGQPHGYLHTASLAINQGMSLKIAFPAELKFVSALVGAKKTRFLDLPFFRIKVFKGVESADELAPFEVIYNQTITVGQILTRSDARLAAEDPLAFDFSGILFSEPLTLLAPDKIQVRIEWNFDLFCGDVQAQLKVGDAVRLIRN
jgi:hypothetical protein